LAKTGGEKRQQKTSIRSGVLPVQPPLAIQAPATPPQTSAPLHFEAASLKLAADQNMIESRPKRSLGRFQWNTYLLNMLSYAYHIEWWRISDTPGLTTIYTLQATTLPNTTQDQVRLMLQTLLIARFQLEVHRATKDGVEGYSLTVAKGGPKLQETKALVRETGATEFDDGYVVGTLPTLDSMILRGHNASMPQVAEFLQRGVGTNVLDQTNLPGRYDFDLTCSRDGGELSPGIWANCVKQAGLVMAKYKGPVEFLVIDHLGKLVEN
jgi:uncharacterized protein (TIGR03435 family)